MECWTLAVTWCDVINVRLCTVLRDSRSDSGGCDKSKGDWCGDECCGVVCVV